MVALRIEHYPGMTQRALADSAAQAEQRWKLRSCTIIHRTGRLVVGETIVLVIATAQHRHPALEATRFLIDWLKTDAPLWKCQEFSDGSSAWVEARATDAAARDAWLV